MSKNPPTPPAAAALIARQEASLIAQRAMLDRVSSKLIRIMRIAEAERHNDIEAWDAVLEIMREDRTQTPVDDKVQQAIAEITAVAATGITVLLDMAAHK